MSFITWCWFFSYTHIHINNGVKRDRERDMFYVIIYINVLYLFCIWNTVNMIFFFSSLCIWIEYIWCLNCSAKTFGSLVVYMVYVCVFECVCEYVYYDDVFEFNFLYFIFFLYYLCKYLFLSRWNDKKFIILFFIFFLLSFI